MSLTQISVCLTVEDTAHSERYMGMATPNDNLDGYEVSSILLFFYIGLTIIELDL